MQAYLLVDATLHWSPQSTSGRRKMRERFRRACPHQVPIQNAKVEKAPPCPESALSIILPLFFKVCGPCTLD